LSAIALEQDIWMCVDADSTVPWIPVRAEMTEGEQQQVVNDAAYAAR
jgi:hypothetical protein